MESGDNALIGGFIITGNQPKRVLLRAIGPSLPVAGALADPQLQIFNSAGEEIGFNNNWRDASNRQEISDSTIAPGNDLESAVLRSLASGSLHSGGARIERHDRYRSGGSVTISGQGADAKLANISTRGSVPDGR